MLFQKATLWVIIQFTDLSHTPVILPEIFGGSISSVKKKDLCFSQWETKYNKRCILHGGNV